MNMRLSIWRLAPGLAFALWAGAACTEAGGLPEEPDDAHADTAEAPGEPLTPPSSLGLRCEGRACTTSAGSTVTYAPGVAFVGEGTGLEVVAGPTPDTLVLSVEAGRTPPEVGGVLIDADSPDAVPVKIRGLTAQADGTWLATTTPVGNIVDIATNIDSVDMRPDYIGPIESELGDALRLAEVDGKQDAAKGPGFEIEIEDGGYTYKMEITDGISANIGVRDLDFNFDPSLKFFLQTPVYDFVYNANEPLLESQGVNFLAELSIPVSFSATIYVQFQMDVGDMQNPYVQTGKRWKQKLQLFKIPAKIPVCTGFYISAELGGRMEFEFGLESTSELAFPITVGGTLYTYLKRKTNGTWERQATFAPNNSLDVEFSKKVEAKVKAAFVPYVRLWPLTFTAAAAEFNVPLGLSLTTELLAQAGTQTSGAAIRYTLKRYLEVNLTFDLDFLSWSDSDEPEAKFTLYNIERFILCGQCATWFNGCRNMCLQSSCVAKCDCVPNCKNKQCGSDGCGGTCGTCPRNGDNPNETTCNTFSTEQYGAAPGTCYCRPAWPLSGCKSSCGTIDESKCAEQKKCNRSTGVCEPRCSAGMCGVQADGYDCGACAGGKECINGQCLDCGTCQGCGGEDACGRPCTCPEGEECVTGTCVEKCAQTCAPDQHCQGGVCVGCSQTCGPSEFCLDGQCKGCDPECGPSEYCDRGQCKGCAQDCGTQAYCLAGACVACAATCAPGTRCIEGRCEPCSCDLLECGSDGCGSSCGECGEFETCENGQCEACQPDCPDGVQCGDDGCGGTCGTCPQGQICDIGAVCRACTPSCEGKVCGTDGCLGSCGTCDAGETCIQGRCLGVPLEQTCLSRQLADRCCDSRDDDCRSESGNCYCDTFCEIANDCCADYQSECQ